LDNYVFNIVLVQYCFKITTNNWIAPIDVFSRDSQHEEYVHHNKTRLNTNIKWPLTLYGNFNSICLHSKHLDFELHNLKPVQWLCISAFKHIVCQELLWNQNEKCSCYSVWMPSSSACDFRAKFAQQWP